MATVYRWIVKLNNINQVAAVEVIIQEEIEQSYLNELQLSAKAVARRIFLKCRDHGYDLPSEGTIRDRIRRLPPSTQVERRMGKKAARERFHPKSGHLPGADYPYALVEIDHTPLDLILVDDILPLSDPRKVLSIATCQVNTNSVKTRIVGRADTPSDDWQFTNVILLSDGDSQDLQGSNHPT